MVKKFQQKADLKSLDKFQFLCKMLSFTTMHVTYILWAFSVICFYFQSHFQTVKKAYTMNIVSMDTNIFTKCKMNQQDSAVLWLFPTRLTVPVPFGI